MDLHPLTTHHLISPITSPTYLTSPTSPTPSYTYLTSHPSLPPTPRLLSRPSSTTRLRQPHSTITIPTSTSTPALRAVPKRRSKTLGKSPVAFVGEAAPLGTASGQRDQRKRKAVRNTNETEDDWITRTASTLTLARLEEKGVSWLAQRESSTSLTGAGAEMEGLADDEFESATQSPEWVRSGVGSRVQSRVQSRRPSMPGFEGDVEEGMRPDFVEGFDEGEEGEREGEEVDEGEMRRVVMGRVGGWVDWAVGWMDFREEEGEGAEEDGGDGGKGVVRGGLDVEEVQRRLGKQERLEAEDAEGKRMDPPPKGKDVGLVNDAKWLLGVASKVAL